MKTTITLTDALAATRMSWDELYVASECGGDRDKMFDYLKGCALRMAVEIERMQLARYEEVMKKA